MEQAMTTERSRAQRLAVLISGSGTTLRNLLQWQTAGKLAAQIVLVGSSSADAAGLQYAAAAGIPCFVVDHRTVRDEVEFSRQIFTRCRELTVDYVVLGGFLRKLRIPADFERRVVNIHPSLIPAFAGK